MKRSSLLAAVASLAMSVAASAAVLVPGTPVTGTLDGDAAGLLGFDADAQDYVAGLAAPLLDGDFEFMSADYSLGLDLGSDGLLRLWDNTGTGLLGTHVIELSFADAALQLGLPTLSATAPLLSGSLQLQLLSPQSVRLTLTDARIDPGYAYVDAQLALAPVPEPAPAVLLSLGLLGLALRRLKHR
ncbi:PEP-CTERM sorting domain-containing protein [Roseateles sp. LYH14W]|uniref:PEP-CTERM sorting domain-containing protein n=1 Tax=Pelomonas parva TaxID=3299032 RepID=A0ABW7EWT1_9BURK